MVGCSPQIGEWSGFESQLKLIFFISLLLFKFNSVSALEKFLFRSPKRRLGRRRPMREACLRQGRIQGVAHLARLLQREERSRPVQVLGREGEPPARGDAATRKPFCKHFFYSTNNLRFLKEHTLSASKTLKAYYIAR